MNNFYIRRISSLCVLIIEAITALTAFAAPPDSAAYAFGSDYSGHRKESLNLGWKFIRENIAGAESPDFSDRTWATVNLPHDAAIAGSFSRGNALAQNGFLERGAGWYRRHLPYRSQWEGQRVILEFEGVYRCARVYVNGRLCGPTAVSNGYMPFEYDVTDLLREGDNLIAVSYDNTGAPTSRWYNGEGIDRNVWLTIMPPVHVDLYGTRITTPVAEKHRAVASVETTVVNTLPDSAFCSLTTRIFDPDGLKAGEHTACAPLAPRETYIFRQDFEIADPQLWDAGCGRLYRAESSVGSTGQQDDIYTTPLRNPPHRAFGRQRSDYQRPQRVSSRCMPPQRTRAAWVRVVRCGMGATPTHRGRQPGMQCPASEPQCVSSVRTRLVRPPWHTRLRRNA